ncbi:hypothetical protein NL30_37095 [Burkholderia contaminans]|uniref:hypothetical protein n=1 Tax=Burkholderia contaminans TaxID=488447 RepID=UPI00064A9C14|nr:hypothetical protein [Burkholderia contaminans]AKM45435.1 hypothetical protein NL30_37095 [Burkholderia contaminans]
MSDYKISGSGEMQVSVDENGTATLNSGKPVRIDPALPVTDIRVNLVEVVALSIVMVGSTRVVCGQYADGGSFEVMLNLSNGQLDACGVNVTTAVQKGADQSHTVVTYMPRVRSITKVAH